MVTSALPYVNYIPHVGHIVGCHLPGDIFSRYNKLIGNDCIYVGGTDEHGTPTSVQAQKLGISPQELCDVFFNEHKRIYDWFQIGYDNFSRTSRKIHHKTTQDFFNEILKNGFIEEMDVELPYCEKCRRTLPDRYVYGTCYYCGYEKARGDQCEKCTKILDVKKMDGLKCSICGETPVLQNQRHLFLKLDKLSPRLRKWIQSKKGWAPQVKNLAMGWIREKLKPRSITRDMQWGVKVPLKGWDDKVFYVWFDAPIGYISSTKECTKEWKKYWTTADIYHFVGKDNIPFHTIWWGGMLMANGEFSLPHTVAGMQYLNFKGSKASKSSGVGVFCDRILETNIPSDVWRFYLTFLIPENKDTEWCWDEFQEKTNKELLGNYGNLVNRVVSFSQKSGIKKARLTANDKKIIKDCAKKSEKIGKLLGQIKIRESLKEIMLLSDRANKYLQDEKPWNQDDERKQAIMWVSASLIKNITILLWPFMPHSSEKVSDAFGFKISWDEIAREYKGKRIKNMMPLFPKVDNPMLKKLKELTSKKTPVESFFSKKGSMMKTIEYDDFAKIDLRVAEIVSAEGVPESGKLIKLELDVGELGKRTIVAGLAKHYKPSDMVGKRIIIVANLEPKKMMGTESQGMLLATDSAVLLTTEKGGKNGEKIR